MAKTRNLIPLEKETSRLASKHMEVIGFSLNQINGYEKRDIGKSKRIMSNVSNAVDSLDKDNAAFAKKYVLRSFNETSSHERKRLEGFIEAKKDNEIDFESHKYMSVLTNQMSFFLKLFDSGNLIKSKVYWYLYGINNDLKLNGKLLPKNERERLYKKRKAQMQNIRNPRIYSGYDLVFDFLKTAKNNPGSITREQINKLNKIMAFAGKRKYGVDLNADAFDKWVENLLKNKNLTYPLGKNFWLEPEKINPAVNDIINNYGMKPLTYVNDKGQTVTALPTREMVQDEIFEAYKKIFNFDVIPKKSRFIHIHARNDKIIRYKANYYLEMLARTELRTASSKALLNRAIQYNNDLVYISYHSNPCRICVKYEGQIYSISGTDDYYPPLQDQVVPLHPNCKHVMSTINRNVIEIFKESGRNFPEPNPVTIQQLNQDFKDQTRFKRMRNKYKGDDEKLKRVEEKIKEFEIKKQKSREERLKKIWPNRRAA